MNAIRKSILLSVCCLALTACDTQSEAPAKAQAEAKSGEEQRSAKSIAVERFSAQEDACAFLVGVCLNDTRLCLDQEDDGVCSPNFEACREDMFAQGCESDSKINIGLNSTLRCWNQFEVCASTDSDDASCAAGFNACIDQGSLCEIDAESECDAQLCDAENCEEVRWGSWGSWGGAGSSSSSNNNSWGKKSWGGSNNSWGKGSWGSSNNNSWGKSSWGGSNGSWGSSNSSWGKKSWGGSNNSWGKGSWGSSNNNSWGKESWGKKSSSGSNGSWGSSNNNSWGKKSWGGSNGSWGG